MTSARRPLRVAVLGARGIGRVHARVFRELGADVGAILGSTDETARATAEKLKSELGVDAKPFFELDRLLAEPLDAISVCTPPRLHIVHLVAAFDRGLPVFCEKPLFWEGPATPDTISRKLAALETHPNRQLFVNTSNAAFIDAVRCRLPPAAEAKRFYFRFHTNGPYRGSAIAVDLMPHALSLLIRLLGRRTLSAVRADFAETLYRCEFSYGSCAVEMDLRQGHGGPRELAFRVDEREFRRIQEGDGATYRVYLHDAQDGDRIEIEDPFKTYISRFLGYLGEPPESRTDDAEDATANMRLMAQVLSDMPRGEGN